jgi:hypothetical protein
MLQLSVSVFLAVAAQQVGTLNAGAIQAIGPKQDDPRASCGSGGGLAIGPKQDDPRKLAIGPKQDDPRKGIIIQGGKQGAYNPETDPQAQGGAEMIGPKQDDPRTGIIVQGGIEAIGPKQDDPRSPGQLAAGAYNPETDPQARGAACKTKR